MEIADLKDRIIDEGKIEDILSELGMHHIKNKGKHISCGMPTGDNKSSTIIYKESLNVDAHTRSIKEKNGTSDIISLVKFVHDNNYLPDAIKWLCDVCGFDYYGRDYEKPELLSFLSEIKKMHSFNEDDEDIILEPLDESKLKYFGLYPSYKFWLDGIATQVQKDFGIGYDLMSHRITIPIRDELGTLVGVKGRAYLDNVENKYMYLYPCNKSKIVFNLHRAKESIIKNGMVYVGESEKAPMQSESHEVYNTVSIGGHQLSSHQVRLLSSLGVPICLVYDDMADYITVIEDGKKILKQDKDFYKNEANKFPDYIKVYAIVDRKNDILGKKESPYDNMHRWDELSTKYRKLIIRE